MSGVKFKVVFGDRIFFFYLNHDKAHIAVKSFFFWYHDVMNVVVHFWCNECGGESKLWRSDWRSGDVGIEVM